MVLCMCASLINLPKQKALTVNQATLQEPHTKTDAILLRLGITSRVEAISLVIRLSAQSGEHDTVEASHLKIQ